MRVNPNYSADILAAIGKTQMQEQTAIQQLSSGKRVAVPSDDPAASAAMVENQARTDRDDVYLQSVTSLKAQLQTADSALSSVVTGLTRAITLGTEGANGTMSDTNRQQIAADVQGVLDGVLQAANIQDQGVYLFAGTKVTQAPFSVDTTTGTITYHGNSGASAVTHIAISDGRSIEANVPGDQLFMNANGSVLNSLQNLITALKSGNTSTIESATNEVSTALSQLSTKRVSFGNSINQLDSAETYLKNDQVNLASQENDLVGVDITKAATDLAQAVTANSAALSAFAKMSQKTLLDYLG